MSFRILFFCPHWGAQDSWDSFCERVKNAGYDGVESDLPLDPTERAAAIAALKKFDLLFIGQYWQSLEDNAEEVAVNADQFYHNLLHGDPLFINSQTGRDYFSFEENKMIVQHAVAFTDKTGMKIVHETHRGKMAYAAHVTKKFLKQIPALRLTLDISHWCNVHETMLQGQDDAVALALNHTDHIHSRVGHTQGPQVNDPRAPEWKDAVQKHLEWWDKVVAIKKKNNEPLTITTEFGPSPYMPLAPYTLEPLANQWEINVYMMNLLKARYADS
jgi:sugar phosphate isomerase/epimerase